MESSFWKEPSVLHYHQKQTSPSLCSWRWISHELLPHLCMSISAICINTQECVCLCSMSNHSNSLQVEPADTDLLWAPVSLWHQHVVRTWRNIINTVQRRREAVVTVYRLTASRFSYNPANYVTNIATQTPRMTFLSAHENEKQLMKWKKIFSLNVLDSFVLCVNLIKWWINIFHWFT